MNDQKHRELVEDQARKRREYLGKVIPAHVSMWIWAVVCAMFALLTVIGAFTYWIPDEGPEPNILSFCVGMGIAIYLTSCWFRKWRSAREKLAAIPFVPPATKQLSTLPAEEILVRGSDQPSATAEELLRASQAGTDLEAEELLRPGHFAHVHRAITGSRSGSGLVGAGQGSVKAREQSS
jgi:hypothetical protein